MSSTDYLAQLCAEEEERQLMTLNLIASENYPTRRVREMLNTPFLTKYAEGYPGVRYYGGCSVVDKLEKYACELASNVFSMPYANVQPHSGAQANMAVYQALLKPGDTVLAIGLKEGGHLTHGSPVNQSGKLYHFISYSVDTYSPTAKRDVGFDWASDYTNERKYVIEMFRELVRYHKPRLIILGGSSALDTIPWEIAREAANEVSAYLMADIAHIAGFVPIVHDIQLEYRPELVDVITMTTQKSLRGPRGGIILSRDPAIAKKIDSAVFPGTQGGPHMNVIAAKAAVLEEAMTRDYANYQKTVVEVADRFYDRFDELCDNRFRNKVIYRNRKVMPHMVIINTKLMGRTGAEVQEALEKHSIIVNKQLLPKDTEKPSVTSGIRLGFNALVALHSESNAGSPNGLYPITHLARAIFETITQGAPEKKNLIILHDYLRARKENFKRLQSAKEEASCLNYA